MRDDRLQGMMRLAEGLQSSLSHQSASRSRASVIAGARVLPLLSVCVAGLLAGCANQAPVRSASYSGVDPKYGVRASPRVVADGEPVPKGGGTSMIGKPYTIAGKTYYPSERPYSGVGLASWYGSDFHGRRTANGEVFDQMSISAAHPTMPLPSYARVTNLRNQHSIIVRVNDRGPYHANRVMDVSQQVAEALEFRRSGTARVRVDYVGRAALAGSDDRKLLATLRTDGAPAGLQRDGAAVETAVAQHEAPAPVRVAATQAVPIQSAPVQPLPVRRNATEIDDDESTASTAPASAPVKIAKAPLPRSRPFDLGTIPGAGVPIAAPRVAPVRFSAPPQTMQALLQETDIPVPPRR